MRINDLTPEEYSIVKILRLMSDPDREWTIKIFWVCAGVVVRQWSTPNDKVKNLKEMETEGLFTALEKGIFADVKRPRNGGKGLDGVTEKGGNYYNPFVKIMKQ